MRAGRQRAVPWGRVDRVRRRRGGRRERRRGARRVSPQGAPSGRRVRHAERPSKGWQRRRTYDE